MQPDLFAGHAQRDNSHRILARLANGGHAPAVARRSKTWTSGQRARLAAVAALLAVIAAAWVGLQDVGTPPPSLPEVVASHAAPAAMTPERLTPAYPSPPQAATIVNEPAHAAPAVSLPPAVATAAKPELRVAHPRAQRPALPVRTQRGEQPAESDEDVTLLTAMLKHANGQKPAPTPPGD
ncbi:hypothetical protein GM658_21290 [Pseudoduganella eburnea]|uniref:Uncharacterized protein n=1 Tax=Massilia eburnea TaxID=1776165 RepID=A0A6L6QNM5_9BURK|nr:hypothetical protein [Massilia eburnea]MTW13143.1 hypothetical protein [Massilia eburnea]